MTAIDEIIEGYRTYSKDEDAIRKIRLAYDIARDCHAGQFRKSGEPYIVHPLAVAKILVDLKMDSSCICAALMHDTLEDTDIQLETIRQQLGREVAGMVDALTKIKTTALAERLPKDHDRAETMRKIVLGMAKNARVIIVKLVDRWNNIQTLQYLSAEKRKQIARETMTIYAPIADRLGLSLIRRDLEDLSFSHIDPKNYQKYQRRLMLSRSFLQKDVESLILEARETLERHGLKVQIYERFKTPHSLYQRAQQNLPTHFLHISVITSSALACYQALGILHETFKPLPGTTIKDYIAIPRTNGYQSLHTYILYKENVYPIQIRSEKMEQIALYGILQSINESSRSRYRGWIRRLQEWVQDESDAQDMIRGIEDLAAQDRIYVCTPQGDYLGFPRGSLVLDFAYRIHTDIGHHCQGALIDERPAGIFETLQDGTMVEIIHSEDIQVQSDWLNHVKTPRSRSAIRNWLENQNKIRSREFGEQLLRIELGRLKINLDDRLPLDSFQTAKQTLGVVDDTDLFFKLGRGIITIRGALKIILSDDEFKRYSTGGATQVSRFINQLFNRQKTGETFEIKNINDPYLKFSKCCNPLPGEDIVGVLSIKHGLSVHRIGCAVLKARTIDLERIVKLTWASDVTRQMPITIRVECHNKMAIAVTILQLMETHAVPVRKFDFQIEKNMLVVLMEILTPSAHFSERILGILLNQKGVTRAIRTVDVPGEDTLDDSA
ncbi:bifunctional (p)ppGpp synthetase/guanosine-3',5'-bis(diphosphate) 3'-pyrophosphohydrolase [bacterium]|nr:bifunctional (p)ppGpp synthetase/guanosine-3',5'-bis(diphosphate) 3'-pyrophosphohydrolase [candidate division CSSED10-310 bacterium]